MRNGKYGLPKCVNLGGIDYEIRTDYSAILDIIEVLNDPDFSDEDKCQCVIEIFYVDYEKIPIALYPEAIKQCYSFIDGGRKEESNQKSPKLMDWEQDFPLIIGAINRVIGQDIRAIDYDPIENKGGLHWFTFLAAYQEIGECLFSQIVSIRDKLARGKKLEKYERDWLNRNRNIVDLRQKLSQEENDLASSWMGGGKKNG